MDREVCRKGMVLLSALFPDYPLKDETMEGYWQFLQHLTNLDFERAVKHHISTCKWFPKVSELLDALRNQGPTPIDIWNRLIAAAEMGTEPEMDEPTKTALAVLGGWERFQYTPFEELNYRFKDFKSALLEARARGLALVSGEQAALEEPK
jgi:hypothetical protein